MLSTAAEPAHIVRLRMTASARKNPVDLSLPGQGAFARAFSRSDTSPGRTVPATALYAIENGPSGFNPASPEYFPKIRFLMLMRNARLAELRTAFDAETHGLTIRHENHEAAKGDFERRKAARNRGILRRILRRRIARPAEGAAAPRATAFPTSRTEGACRSSTSRRVAAIEGRDRRAGPSVALSRQPHVDRLAGLA